MPSPFDMNQPVAYWANQPLLVMGARKPLEHAINIKPNLNLLAGTVMGEVSATLGTFGPYAGSTIGTPAAQTPTLANALTGGGLAGSQTIYVVYAWVNGAGETVKSTEASIAIPATTNTNAVTVTAPIALPNGALGLNVYVGTSTGVDYFVGYAPGNTFVITGLATGTRVPLTTSTAVAATDGTQNAKCVLPNAIITDALGNIYSASPFGGSTGIPIVPVQSTFNVGLGGILFGRPEIDAFFGQLECYAGDMYGLDQAALTAGFGRIENGVLGGSGAIFRLP